MKKIALIVLLCAPLMFTSCNDDEANTPSYNKYDTNLDNLQPYQTMHVDVQPGYAKIIKYRNDTLAVCTKTTDISVPKNASIKGRAESTPISIDSVRNENNFFTQQWNSSWQMIAFEDSRIGTEGHSDYDFNDLIIHAYIRLTPQGYLEVKIQPIALGSTKKIKLGFEKMDGTFGTSEVIISEDCRKDLFDGIEGMINTRETSERHIFGVKYKNTFAKQSDNIQGAVNWFIEVDNGVRLYAITNNPKCLNLEGVPYGLILTDIYGEYKYCNSLGKKCGLDWWLYPKENVSINSVYDLEEYLKTGNQLLLSTPKEDSDYYDAIKESESTVINNLLYCPNSLYN